jgi:hypothetical protein
VYKAEVLAKGPNTRFVVTNRPEPYAAVHGHYTDRGQSENFLKDFKNALCADRLSDHRFLANQFRLLLHAAAYRLLHTLRSWLSGTEAALFQFDTLRLQLLKLGGRVRELATRVRLHLAASHPGETLWQHLALQRQRLMNNPGQAATPLPRPARAESVRVDRSGRGMVSAINAATTTGASASWCAAALVHTSVTQTSAGRRARW